MIQGGIDMSFNLSTLDAFERLSSFVSSVFGLKCKKVSGGVKKRMTEYEDVKYFINNTEYRFARTS